MKNLMRASVLVLIAAMNPVTVIASQATAPLAVIYHGPGACTPCVTGAVKAAKAAGLEVELVNEKLQDFSVLARASVWIQPGGTSKIAIEAMGPAFLEQLRQFVAQGGGYVGFCAGAFLSTKHNGTTESEGLGIVPGRTLPLFEYFSPEDHPYLLNLTWGDRARSVYFNGGAYFDLTGVNDPNLQVLATYDDYDHKIAAIFTRFGLGHVAVTGAHPEEINAVKLARFMRDRDGSDRFLAVEMIKSALRD